MPARNASLIILGAAALLGAAWILFFDLPAPQEMPPAQHSEQPKLERPRTKIVQTEPSAPAPAPAQATLVVAEHRYPILLDAEKTVLSAMQYLASSKELSFSGKEFPSLGFFVESINGTKNAGGRYWILYRNGAQSMVGASSATIGPGDVIEWKYE